MLILEGQGARGDGAKNTCELKKVKVIINQWIIWIVLLVFSGMLFLPFLTKAFFPLSLFGFLKGDSIDMVVCFSSF